MHSSLGMLCFQWTQFWSAGGLLLEKGERQLGSTVKSIWVKGTFTENECQMPYNYWRMSICLQETDMQYRHQPLGSFGAEVCICSSTPSVPQGRSPFALAGHTQRASPLPHCPKKLLPPTSAHNNNYSTCSTFLFWPGLNHLQWPKKWRCLTDCFKALSFMVHYQDLVNSNRLFLPACEDAAECFISGNAVYKYGSVNLWHTASRNCFPLRELAMVRLFWT